MIPLLREIVLLTVSLSPLSAQGNRGLGTLVGTVKAADDGTPLPFGRISIIGTRQTTVTAADGAFIILQVAPGVRVIQVRLVGYRTLLTSVTVADDTARMQITLATLAVSLDPVEVTGRAAPRMPAMQGFEERRRFTDLLRRIPGVQLQPTSGPYDGGQVVRMSRTIGVNGSRACPILYYVNGSPFPVTGDIPVDQFIDPNDVAAIEVYSGMSQIPPEFLSSSHDARCGVVVIWTISSLDTLKTDRHQ
ncbi:MAG: hypothetical protein E6J91_48245 [Deltaproteobacteria bacterium]|nr:MAG: hypothetical protein E6J91_48245 [Deltaproteobacteria bacterium]